MLYEAFEKGRAQGFKFGMFHRSNPYKPGTPVFEAWERGFDEGYKARGWL